ncbi:MAG: MBL fold metallo-hydrolase, partial [Lachnospiraceae bacterium]|nr:MBL fold metallo-hydrolase [Lachnospiraceae bacterium]
MAQTEIYVTYLGHSGFLIETPEATMLFDWVGGKLPSIRNDKALCIFVSHIHSDHFNPAVFGLAGGHPNSEIYIGYDRSEPSFEKMLDGLPEDIMDKISFFDGKQKLIIDIAENDITVNSLKSTDLGVAFLVEADGKTFY